MGKVKYRKPRLSAGSSMTPAVFLDKVSVKKANKFISEWPDRMQRGMELVCLEALGLIRDAVVSGAPILPDGTDYAKDLKVALVNGGEGVVVCLYWDSKSRKITPEDSADSALYFTARKNAPDWVRVLERFNPWPAGIVPEKPSPGEADVVVRKITGDEKDALTSRLISMRAKVESALKNGGLENPTIGFDESAMDGLEVMDDVGYSVLRAEFGYGGQMSAHWRPAVKRMMDSLPRLGAKFVKYVETGSEGVFDLPDFDSIGMGQYASYGQDFQGKIASGAGVSG